MQSLAQKLSATQEGIETGEKLLTADDLAILFQVSKHQILRWYHGEGLPGKTFSRKCVRFQWSDVARWIESRSDFSRSA